MQAYKKEKKKKRVLIKGFLLECPSSIRLSRSCALTDNSAELSPAGAGSLFSLTLGQEKERQFWRETRSLPPPWMTSRHTPTQQFQFPLQQRLQNQLPLFAKSLPPICVHPKSWRAPPPEQRGPLLRSPPALFLTAHLKSCTVGRSWSRRSILAPFQPGWRWGGLEHRSLQQSQPQVLVPETRRRRSQIWGRSWLSWAPNKVSGVWGPVGPAAWKLQVQNSPSKQNSIRLQTIPSPNFRELISVTVKTSRHGVDKSGLQKPQVIYLQRPARSLQARTPALGAGASSATLEAAGGR